MGFTIKNGVLTKYKPKKGETNVVIPDGVTEIGEEAFYDCHSLISVTIPDSVTAIRKKAFYDCEGLTSVTIPDSVTTIEKSAFCGCEGLTSVTIPNSVTIIEKDTFCGCEGLTSVTIPDSVTTIEKDAFYGCKGLTSVTIPDSVTTIEKDAFYGCKGLTAVTLPNHLTSITGFNGCTGLTSITIPNSVTSIGEHSFVSCTGLTSITIPDSVTSIGREAFKDCTGLATVTVPEAMTDVSTSAFTNTKWMEENTNPFVIAGKKLLKYTGNAAEVTVPDGIAVIAYGAFAGHEELKSVMLPDSLVELEDYHSWKSDGAFSRTGLTSVTIPDSVTKIGSYAFRRCEALTSVTIPNSVTSIGESAFYECEALTSVTIPDSVTSIGESAFYGCEALTSVTIPDSVTKIGSYAFRRCEALTSVTIPDSVTAISRYAFIGCAALTSVIIPDSVTSIGESAFYECEALTSVTIPDSVTSIGESAFYGCEALTSVTIPDSVTEIGKEAFRGCEALTSVAIPASVTSIGEQAFAYIPLKEFTVDGNNAVVSDKVFGDSLPEGLAEYAAFLIPNMNDKAIIKYVLPVWDKTDIRKIAELFLAKQSQAFVKVYSGFKGESLNALGAAILEILTSTKLSAKMCNAAGNFISMFYNQADTELLKSIYHIIMAEKNGKKAVAALETNPVILELLNVEGEVNRPTAMNPLDKKILAQISEIELNNRLNQYYTLKLKDLPVVHYLNGDTVSQIVFAWLLTIHENHLVKTKLDEIRDADKKLGIMPEAQEIVDALDQNSFQAALKILAEQCIGKSHSFRRNTIAYPICRYADEKNIAILTQQAPNWRTYNSGNNAPMLRLFRDACLYSDTRAAILFAEKMKDLSRYAAIRGTDAETIRDTQLSDVGLDENGCKSYDLGNQTVTVRMQPDYSFIVELPNGKTAKSLPKKGADEEKHAAANKDFLELKKQTKKIVKNRFGFLFNEFLDEGEKNCDSWKAVYFANPVLKQTAMLIVWAQGTNTFTMTTNGLIDSSEQPYTLTDEVIKVAHPMEMDADDVTRWQKYFTRHSLKQPFAQIWEPVVDPEIIKEDRYAGAMIPYYRFLNQEKHGIYVEDEDFHNSIYISFACLDADVERIDWARHNINASDRFEVKKVSFFQYSRQANHIIAYLDKITIWERVRKDDVSVMDQLSGFTMAQIMEFISAATEANAVNITALLLDYLYKTFPDYDPMEEFTLDW